jgi:hypothetical protein
MMEKFQNISICEICEKLKIIVMNVELLQKLLQCFFLKVKILIMFLIDMVNITSGQNNWVNFFPETGPF